MEDMNLAKSKCMAGWRMIRQKTKPTLNRFHREQEFVIGSHAQKTGKEYVYLCQIVTQDPHVIRMELPD